MISRLSAKISSQSYSPFTRTHQRSAISLALTGLSRHYASDSFQHPNNKPLSEPWSKSIGEYSSFKNSNNNDTALSTSSSSKPSVSLNTPVVNKAHFSEPPPLIEEQMSSIESEYPQSTPTTTSSTLNSRMPNSHSTSINQPSLNKRPLSAKELSSYLEATISSYNTIKSFSDLPLEFGYNQHMAIDEELREQLRSVIHDFNAPVKYAFAHGSGIFTHEKPQRRSVSKPQIDLVFGVSYTEHWHSLNMRQNPSHYSAVLKTLGAGAVSLVQDKLGAGVFFNHHPVEVDGLRIRYGVVNIDTLLGDLANWNNMYLAGCLHKPVKILRDEPRIRFTNQANLVSALRAALLLLPEEFTELDLYSTLAGLSTSRAPITLYNEAPKSIQNIANHQFLNFRNLYSPLLDLMSNVELQSSAKLSLSSNPEIGVASMKQDMDTEKRGRLVNRLPKEFREKLYRRYQSKYERNEPDSLIASEFGSEVNANSTAAGTNTLEEATRLGREVLVGSGTTFQNSPQSTQFDRLIAGDKDLVQNMAKAISSTVAWPSLTQSLKGLLTTRIGRGSDSA